ncbi:unnamed protein product [Trichogramma brassicae]|uniref:Uncharacterized protein n=1 Tax=Trichogramma brassicae TaxID=86971 RepID=A0A6H5IP86_9HYME|nr:unnamed protein product [Trichogramma brassicae]
MANGSGGEGGGGGTNGAPKKYRPIGGGSAALAKEANSVFLSGRAANLTLCLLCLLSLGISGMLAFRELRLEQRIAHLESIVHSRALQQHHRVFEAQALKSEEVDPSKATAAASSDTSPTKALIERIRREVLQEIESKKLAEDIFRPKRDLPDCNCPPARDNDSSGPRDENRRRSRASSFHANDFGGVLDDDDYDVSRAAAAASNARVQTLQLSKSLQRVVQLLHGCTICSYKAVFTIVVSPRIIRLVNSVENQSSAICVENRTRSRSGTREQLEMLF